MEFEPNVKIVSLCGNISSGKSTIVDHIKTIIKDDPNFLIVTEPLDAWDEIKDNKGNGILAAFYENPKSTAFTFQICALKTRMDSIHSAIKEAEKRSLQLKDKVVIIIERTLLDDYHIFAKMHQHAGNITMLEMNVYKMWFSYFYENFTLDACVYVETSPQICHDRMLKRNRNGEECIPLDYLNACHEQHLKFYSNVLVNHNCLKVENNTDLGKIEYKNLIDKILEHFSK